MRITIVSILCLICFCAEAQNKIVVGQGKPQKITTNHVIKYDTTVSTTNIYDTNRVTVYDTNYSTIVYDTTQNKTVLIDSSSGLPNGMKSFTDYGAIPDDNLSDQAAMDSFLADTETKTLLVPAGTFDFDTIIIVDRIVYIEGQGNQQWSWSNFRWASGTSGMHVKNSADGFTLKNMLIRNIAPGNNTTHDGILIQAHGCRFTNVQVENFAGTGFNISSSVSNNANSCLFDHCRARSNGVSGFRAGGSDANAISFIGCDATENGWFGFEDDSFLGNYYFGCHAATNDSNGYIVTNINARSLFVACYSEADNQEVSLAAKAVWMGGINEAGFTGDGQYMDQKFGTDFSQISSTNYSSGNNYRESVFGGKNGTSILKYLRVGSEPFNWNFGYGGGHLNMGNSIYFMGDLTNRMPSRDSTFKDSKVLIDGGLFLGGYAQNNDLSGYIGYRPTKPPATSAFRNGDILFNNSPSQSNGDGSYWQLVNGAWREMLPTPGEAGVIYTNSDGDYRFLAMPSDDSGTYELQYDSGTQTLSWQTN